MLMHGISCFFPTDVLSSAFPQGKPNDYEIRQTVRNWLKISADRHGGREKRRKSQVMLNDYL